jgi:hypothetical protein
MLRSIFALTALLAVTTVHAQSANVVAATSVTNQIDQVTPMPPGGSTTLLNSDQSSFLRIESLAFNNTGPSSLNLLAADNLNHNVVQYTGDFSCTPLINCSKGSVLTQITVKNPQGMSLDRAGDLYLLNDAPGSSPLPAVYVAPTDTMGGFMPSQLIDNTNFGKQQAVVETLIVGTPPSSGTDIGLNAQNGDLLVLATGPNALYRYPRSSDGIGPMPGAVQHTLLAQCTHNQKTACIPAGEVCNGIAIWQDGTLLMSCQSGRILNYDIKEDSPTNFKQLPDFADISAGLVKIKVARELGQWSAFVSQSGPGNHGSVIEVTTVGGTIQANATVNMGGNTQGIAVTNTAQGLASSCQQMNGKQVAGCDLLGDSKHTVLRHIVKPDHNGVGGLGGAIVEDMCVATDPRYGNPPVVPAQGCGDTSVLVDDICHGFDPTRTITVPGFLCARAGSNGASVAIVRTRLTTVDQYDQTYIENVVEPENVLGGNSEPVCGPVQPGAQIGLVVWGPTPDDRQPGFSNMGDINTGCGTGHGGGYTNSLWAIGMALDTSASELQTSNQTEFFAPQPGNPPLQVAVPLPTAMAPVALENFAQTKFNSLANIVVGLTQGTNGTGITIADPLSQELWNTFNSLPPGGFNSINPGCIDQSWSIFYNAAINEAGQQQAQDFQNAADLLTNADAVTNTTCDYIVTNNASSIQEPNPQTNPPVLNPSGQIRLSLANLYYAINTLLISTLGIPAVPGNSVASTWPPPVAVSVSPQTFVQGHPPPSGIALSWALNFDTTGQTCTWSSNDTNFTKPDPIATNPKQVPVSPPQLSPGTFNYSLKCTVPPGNVQTGNSMTATTWLTVTGE